MSPLKPSHSSSCISFCELHGNICKPKVQLFSHLIPDLTGSISILRLLVCDEWLGPF